MVRIEELDERRRAALASLTAVQRELAAIPDKSDPRREGLKAEAFRFDAEIRALKEQIKAENQKRHFAGLASPLYEACVALLPPTVVAALEADAIARQRERERRAAERQAEKDKGAGPVASAPGPAAPSRRT